jgi:type IV secretory pathway VirJ component
MIYAGSPTRVHGRSSLTAWRAIAAVLTALLSSTRPARAQADDHLNGLTLRWTAPQGAPSRYTAILLSGDGGFADLFTKVADELAEHGVGVVGFNTRSWLSPKKTPDETAVAVARVMRAAMTRYHADSVIIVGYSRGADMVPFVVTRLPEPLRMAVGAIAMIGLGTRASFEYHFTDLFRDTQRAEDVPIGPELLKLRGVSMACLYGTDEKSSACRDAPPGLLKTEARDGGHHLDGDYKAIGEWVLTLVHHPVVVKPAQAVDGD